eukprot:CAMPEP_0175471904 /NCGR_PEP_ID=MMETSP0095-20121207/73597_1 /TAXON_ID=311494 /ORGANISM="Alexandrium monilatum, Strain CCMP3105" /LENGTH=98 /DNA_ID=CAMNT_0016773365 /DNA_START=1 /DNA_END=294 /DNA_ORIENTATION=+
MTAAMALLIHAAADWCLHAPHHGVYNPIYQRLLELLGPAQQHLGVGVHADRQHHVRNDPQTVCAALAGGRPRQGQKQHWRPPLWPAAAPEEPALAATA